MNRKEQKRITSIALSTESKTSARMENDKIERLRERIMSCPICIDDYTDPRILPCHHSVCLHCLLNYVQVSSSSGRLFRCPQCRADVCVPRGGVKDFPPNFYLNCIQDELGARPYYGTCEVCDRDWLLAQYRCVNCDVDICKFCIHEHKLFKHDGTSSLNIMRIETGHLGNQMTAQTSCETHTNESLQMFCLTCDKALCVTCVCDGHKRHHTMPLAQKLAHAEKMLQFDLDQFNTEIRLVKKQLDDLKEIADTMKKSTSETVKNVREQARMLTTVVDQLADARVVHVKLQEKKCVEEIDLYFRELNNYLLKLERVSSFLEELQDGDTSLELLQCFNRYTLEIEMLKKSVTDKKIGYREYSFSAGRHFVGLDYLLSHFGSLQTAKRTVTCLESKKRQKVTHVKRAICRHLTFWNFLVCAVTVAMLFTLCRLVVCVTSEESNFENMAGLVLCSYLYLAAVCAYLRS